MAKYIILTSALIASGAKTLAAAIAKDPATTAAEVILLNTDLDDAMKEISSNLEKISEQEKEISRNLEKISEQTKEIFDLTKINEELESALEKSGAAKPAPAPAKKLEVSKKTFKSGTDVYGFVYPHVSLEGKVITCDHVLADKDLQAKLIEMGSGFIEKK